MYKGILLPSQTGTAGHLAQPFKEIATMYVLCFHPKRAPQVI